MCAIAGVVNFSTVACEERERLEKALGAMLHRGPDAGGVWRCPSGAALLGHRRLAIIDLSSRADQPFVDAETGTALIFYG